MDNKLKINSKKANLFLLFGPAGVGKTTLMNLACQSLGPKKLKRVVTCTTRSARENEQNGIDYIFLSKEQFLKLKSEDYFFETAEFHGNFYGTPIDQLKKLEEGQNLIIATELEGVKAFLSLPEVILIKVSVSEKQLLDRIKNRSKTFDSADTLARLAVDAGQEKNSSDFAFHHELVNNDLNLCLDQLLKIIRTA